VAVVVVMAVAAAVEVVAVVVAAAVAVANTADNCIGNVQQNVRFQSARFERVARLLLYG
jgi:hypothetical protein